MPTIKTTDNTEIHYKDWGKGPVVTFSHGWPLCARRLGAANAVPGATWVQVRREARYEAGEKSGAPVRGPSDYAEDRC